MNIKKEKLGHLNGSDVYEITLEDPGRIKVQLLSCGAAIHRIYLPSKEGHMENVVLSYDTWQEYIHNPLYAGATLGPNAGRIKNAHMVLHNHPFALTPNDGAHNLHGGSHNVSFQNWTLQDIKKSDASCTATFCLQLPDSLDGFPGNRSVKVHYTLQNNSSLEIRFEATTDCPTYLNLSNHAYFNLSGDFNRSGLSQELTINSASYVANDSEHIPAAILPCRDTPFDFTTPATFFSKIRQAPNHPQLLIGQGYNHAFILPPDSGIQKALTLRDPHTGRELSLFTDAPCVVVYSGGYIEGEKKSCAIALEAQDIPDAAHFVPDFYKTRITDPENPFSRIIRIELRG